MWVNVENYKVPSKLTSNCCRWLQTERLASKKEKHDVALAWSVFWHVASNISWLLKSHFNEVALKIWLKRWNFHRWIPFRADGLQLCFVDPFLMLDCLFHNRTNKIQWSPVLISYSWQRVDATIMARLRICKFVTHSDVNKLILQLQINSQQLSEWILQWLCRRYKVFGKVEM